MSVVTRFAPSPTGFMHIGGVRTALYAWLWARKNNGTFILRIEDTDKEREVPGSIDHIKETLHWLGLDWDFGPDAPGPFGPLVQSQRLDTYKEAARELIQKGFAYPDPYSEEEIAIFRANAQSEKRPFLFRDHRPMEFESWDGTKPLRFKVPEIKRTVWTDAVRGQLEAGEEALDDFIIIKSDGYPTYNFAHIVDDNAMGVTYVMRGDEFISSTPKFLSLYDALGYGRPVFATLPPILREDKTKKLGKRDGAKDVLEYRDEGFLPQAMINYLAFLGWNPGTEQELFTLPELIEQFDIAKVHKAGAVFDLEKLKWFNREHILRMPESEFESEALDIMKKSLDERGIAWQEDIARRTLPLVRERISIWEDLRKSLTEGEYDFFFADPVLEANRIPDKKSDANAAAAHLTAVSERISAIPADAFAEVADVKGAVWPYAEEQGRGAVLWPLRYSLSGRERSPDPFTIASIIGKVSTLRRIERARSILIAK